MFQGEKSIDLLMGTFRGAVFHHGGGARNSTLALMGRFPSLMGRFLTLMGRIFEYLNGPLSLLKIPWKTAHQEKAHEEVLEKRRFHCHLAGDRWFFFCNRKSRWFAIAIFGALSFRGGPGNFWGSLGNFRGTLSGEVAGELLGRFGESLGIRGSLQKLSGQCDSLPATRQSCLQTYEQRRFWANKAETEMLGVSRWSPFLKSIRVFSVVGLAVNSD